MQEKCKPSQKNANQISSNCDIYMQQNCTSGLAFIRDVIQDLMRIALLQSNCRRPLRRHAVLPPKHGVKEHERKEAQLPQISKKMKAVPNNLLRIMKNRDFGRFRRLLAKALGH